MVLVTGANGMIGRAIAARLLMAGMDLRLHGRSGARVASALDRPKAQIVELDFHAAERAAYDDMVRGCHAVVHCAALVHRRSATADLYHRLNVRPTKMLADAAGRHGIRSFILLSTVGVYGPGPFQLVSEDAELRPVTPYAASKLRCEEEVAAASEIRQRIILRPALVFGEGDRGNLLTLIRLIDKGIYCHVAGNVATKSMICAPDLASVVQRCLDRLPAGCHIFNAGNAEPVGVTELANLIASCLKRRPPRSLPHAVVEVGAALLAKRDAVRTLLTTTTCSIERLVSAIGSFSAMPLVEALLAEIRWARTTGLLRAAA